MRVGERIREQRKKQGMTLQKLSERAGVSASLLSQVETGRADVSLKSLQSIAAALNISLTDLFSEQDSFQVNLVRASEKRIYMIDGGGSEQLLFSSARTALQAAIIELPTGSCTPKPDSHPGEEFSYVLCGTLRMQLGDNQMYTLEQGDLIYYSSEVPHRWINDGPDLLRVLIANTPATF